MPRKNSKKKNIEKTIDNNDIREKRERVKYSHNIHRILRIFTDCRLKGKSIPWDMNIFDVISKAEQEQELYKYNGTTFFCCYKTEYKEKPAMYMLFIMDLPGSSSGSSSATEYVMDIITMLEHQFVFFDNHHFTRQIDVSKRNIGLLRLVKVIDEESF